MTVYFWVIHFFVGNLVVFEFLIYPYLKTTDKKTWLF